MKLVRIELAHPPLRAPPVGTTDLNLLSIWIDCQKGVPSLLLYNHQLSRGGLRDLQSFRDTLVASAAELGHGPDAFRPLDDAEAAMVAAAVERAFGDAANGSMVGWWRSGRACPLPATGRCFREGGWCHLAAVAPAADSPVWLLAENWWRGQPPLCAFASTAGVVQAVLGNTHGFEYVVAGRQFDWLFAEDHEGGVSVAGAAAVERLRRVAEAE